MRTIKLLGNVGIATLLEVCSTGYVTVMVSGEKADFIFNSSDIFCKCTVDCYGSGEDTVLRIPKSHILAAAREGILQIDVVGEMMQLSIQNEEGRVFYSVIMKLQTAFTEQIEFMQEIADGLKHGLKLNASKLLQLNKIASLVSGQINLDSGLASARFLAGRGFVWKPFEPGISFAISCQTFKHLYKVSQVFYSYQNFIGAIGESIVMICKKRNVVANTELKYTLDYPEEFKSRWIGTVSFQNLQKFLAESKLKFDSVEINLDTQNCTLDVDSQKYTIPIWVGETKAAPGSTGGVVAIPKEILLSVLPTIQSSEFTLKIKKSFVQMNSEDFSVIF